MTNAEKALEDLFSGQPYTMIELSVFLGQHAETIARSLKIAAAVDGDEWEVTANNMHHAPEWSKGNNDLLERLRGIK